MTLDYFQNNSRINVLPEQPDTKDIIGKTLHFVNNKEKYRVIDYCFYSECECTSDCDCEDIVGTQFICVCIESPTDFMLGLTFRFDAREWFPSKNNNIVVE